jgi:hypothetical protein
MEASVDGSPVSASGGSERLSPFANEAALEEPVEISPGVWWVGVRLALYTAKRSGRDRVCAAETLVRSSD